MTSDKNRIDLIIGKKFFDNKIKVKYNFIGDHKIMKLKFLESKKKYGKGTQKLKPEMLRVKEIKQKIREYLYKVNINNGKE